MSNRTLGYILTIISAILYSSLGILGKYIYSTGLEMSQVIVLRFMATVIALGVFMLIRRKEPLLTRSPSVLFQGLFFVATAVFYFMAVKYLSAGLATVILFAYPALVAALAVIFFREKIGMGQLIGLGLALLGLFFISGLLIDSSTQLSSIGLVFAILSSIVFALYSLLGQKSIKKDGVFTITFTVALFGLVLLAFIFPGELKGLVAITPYQAFLGLVMAVLSTILPVVLFLKGVQMIGASMASLISISEIPFALLLAYLLLGEVLTTLQIVGTVLIVIATFVAITSKE